MKNTTKGKNIFSNKKIGQSFLAQKLIDISKGSNKFEDQFFPPNDSSLYSSKPNVANFESPEIPKFMQLSTNKKFLSQFALDKENNNFEWTRLSKLYDLSKLNICKFSKNDDGLVTDVIQGNLGDCYFLSAICALSENPERIKALFPNQKIIDKGVFEVLVYLHGNPTLICIDDYFPTRNIEGFEPQLAFASINEKTNNIWPLILEKAWAKCNGSYEDIIAGNTTDAFEFLTPAPFDTYHHNVDTSKLYDIIQHADQNGFIICADITETETTNLQALSEMGLITNHSYTVIDTAILRDDENKHQHRLLKLKNVWATNEWLGDWSDGSRLWTEDFKHKLNYKEKEEGVFWMCFEDYIRFYTTTHICRIHDGYKFVSKKFYVNSDHPFCIVKVNISKDIKGYFEVNLKNKRIYSNLKGIDGFENPYCSMTVFYQKGEEMIYIGADCGKNDRLYVECEEMVKGTYYIAVSFPLKNTQFEISEEYEVNQFEKMSYRIGVYSQLDNIPINEVSEEEQQKLANFMDDIISDLARNDSEENKYYFAKEGEKDSYRVVHFDDDRKGFGYVYYENNSDAYIREKMSIIELDNINIFPMLKEGEFHKLELTKEEEVEFEDVNVQKDIDYYRNNTKLKSNIRVLRPVKTYEAINKDNPLEIEIIIAPHSYGIVILQKTDTESVIDFDSDICFEYLVDTILSGRLFKSKKFVLKYNNKLVDIFECVTEHNTGAIFQYKNKTKELRLTMTIKFNTLNNLELAEKTQDVTIEDGGKGGKIVTIIVGPNETKYFSVKAMNVFEKFNYSCQIEYHFSLAEETISVLKPKKGDMVEKKEIEEDEEE